jgi:hypothetical protein
MAEDRRPQPANFIETIEGPNFGVRRSDRPNRTKHPGEHRNGTHKFTHTAIMNGLGCRPSSGEGL